MVMCPQQADSVSMVKDESSEHSMFRCHHSHSHLCSLCVPTSSSGYESSLSMCELTVPLELMEVKRHVVIEVFGLSGEAEEDWTPHHLLCCVGVTLLFRWTCLRLVYSAGD